MSNLAPTQTDRLDVLVVEDEASVAALMQMALEDLGYRVALARDGLQALELLETASFRLIITDLAMPRMGGVELMQRLSEQGSDTPVVVISARTDMALQVEPLGPAAMIRKPFDLDEFERVVQAQL